MKKKNVLLFVDYVARTGFGTVSKNIVSEVKKAFGDNLILDIIAINYFGEPYYEDENTYVVSAPLNDDNKDNYGRYFFLKVLKESDAYDGVFICQDVGIILPIVEVMEHILKEKKKNNIKSFKAIYYFPVDCALVPALVNHLEFFDLLVTYTQYGKDEVLKLRPELKTKIKVIPHGNNSKEFYPIEDKNEVKKFRDEYFGENSSKYIITNVNRNQPRKDIPNTIFGFIEAKKLWPSNLPKPFLYLHCHPNDPLGWDIRGIMIQTELVEGIDFKLLPDEYLESGCEDEVVNKIYNASDIFLTTTLGEGWGLTFTEAAACKVPIVAPYSTSFMEMSNYGKNAYMLYSFYPYCNQIDNVIREQTDIYEIAETLVQVAKDKISNALDLKFRLENSYNWVRKLEWKEVCKSWVEYFKNVY
jgi:glycosyltransferase involved in cell wall biosynthesis